MGKIAFVITIVFLLGESYAATEPNPTTCPGDLKQKQCGTACEKTCGQPEPFICTQQCVIACQCEHNQWRSGNNCYNTSAECPIVANVTCQGDLVHTDCGTACEKTCGQPEAVICTANCVVGCQCPHNQWRQGNRCYNTSEQCPPTCEGDLTYNTCGTACEKKCGEEEPSFCTYQCVAGCQCGTNQWRSGNNCFNSSAECPPTCEGDLTYATCGTACEKICGQEEPSFCTYQCVAGCQCRTTQWKDGNNCYNTSAECPTAPTCEGDLVHTDCGTACEKTCGAEAPTFCTEQCVIGCQCPEGKWRKGNKCYIKSDECPTTRDYPTCEGDLVHTECGTACEQTCGEDAPEVCTQQCVIGCQCPEGHWRKGNKCYKDEKCAGCKNGLSFILVILVLASSSLVF